MCPISIEKRYIIVRITSFYPSLRYGFLFQPSSLEEEYFELKKNCISKEKNKI